MTPAMTHQSPSSHEMPSLVSKGEKVGEDVVPIVVEWIESVEAIDPIVHEWELLRSRSGCVTSNNDPQRYLDTLGAMAGVATPLVGVFRREGLVCGLILARRSRRRIPLRIGYLPLRTPKMRCVDVVYGGILLDDVAAVGDFIVGQLYNLLIYRGIDHVMINKLSVDHPLFGAITNLPRVVAQKITSHLALKLNDSFEETMRRHSSKHLKKLRWEKRKLAKSFGDDLEYRTLEGEDVLEQTLADAEAISLQTYHSKVGGMVQRTDVWRAQLRGASQSHTLRAHFLVAQGNPIAFLLALNDQDRLHVAAMAHLPEHAAYSPGKHLLLHAIQRACEDGLHWIDYGFGDAAYKRIYGSTSWDEATIHLYGRGLRARSIRMLDRAVVISADLFMRFSDDHTVQRLRRAWRSILTPRKNDRKT